MSVAENGRAQLSLPFVDDANLDINCPQNIHLTCDSEMMSEGADLDSSPTTNGFLLRGNTVMGNLREISVSTKRASDLGRFATRATHSKPTAYIVGSLATDHLTSTNKLALTISATKPDCPIIGDEHTAYRLSYLWAKNEIENTLKSGNQGEAYDLSTIYRVVSPISGAVVLERKSDYEAWNLDRDLYANKSELVRRAAPSPSWSPSASPMPNKKSSQSTVVGDQTAEAEGKFELSPATTGGIAGGITPSVAMATPTNTIELAPASKPSALKPRFELVGPVGIWAMLLLAVNFAAAISTYLMIMRFKKLK
jgi:hypothetical protein